jgi:acetylornithine deacetylase/succinyl-diaminopimelate desuccinylase-like protein
MTLDIPRDQCLALATEAFDDGRFFATLAERVAQPTESDQDVEPARLNAYLRGLLDGPLAKMDFSGSILPNPAGHGGPILIARRIEGDQLPTVLTYGHGDVVSGQAGRWRAGFDPWVLRAEGERWYGRGTADNKGQHSINLAGLQAALAARGGRLGYNVTLLLEMGEEAGSPGLREVCDQQRDALRADLLVACDGPRVSAARPTLFLGSRGAFNFSLRLRARDRAHHSGNWGGVLVNPATVLAHAVASMVDARGRMLVEGLRPPWPDAALREVLARVQVGGGPDDPEADADWGEPGLSVAEKLFGWNTLEVLAMGAGNPQRPVNAVPHEAVVHMQLRFVVGTRWQDLVSLLRQHLDAQGFGAVEIEPGMACAATRLDVNHPWVGWAMASIERSSGRAATLLPNLAGSLPNDLFADLLGLPTLWVPHSYPGCNQHAPDEHLLAPVAREGLRIMAGLYWDLGDRVGAPWFGGTACRV